MTADGRSQLIDPLWEPVCPEAVQSPFPALFQPTSRSTPTNFLMFAKEDAIHPSSLASILAPLAALAAVLIAWIALLRFIRGHALARRVLRALRIGGTPTSVAFIMDGNRRWAKARGRPAYQGHPRGGEKLAEILQWCLDAGIGTVTVYAFSIENFKRPQQEIDQLFSLAYEKVTQMLEHADDIVQVHRVRVNILGDLDLLPPRLQKVFAKVMRNTRRFTDGPTLNICFAYTARADMARALSTTVQLCDRNLIQSKDIDTHLFSACLQTGYASGAHESICSELQPELLVRTSGETRLSDFLVLQCAHSIISFYSVLWPDITAWDMVRIILDYQKQSHARTLSQLKCNNHITPTPVPDALCAVLGRQVTSGVNERIMNALETVRLEHFARIDHLATLRT